MFEHLESRRLLSVDIINGVVTIGGTPQADNIRLWQQGSDLVISFNGEEQTVAAATFSSIWVDTGGGNDYISAARDYSTSPHPASPFACTILGGSGHDTILGSDANDLLVGGAGNDTIEAGAGDDIVYGSRGDDLIDGGEGINHLSGAAGNDTAQYYSKDDVIDGAERLVPVNQWVPTTDWDEVLDLRVKYVANRGYVAVLDFYWGYGNRITVAVEHWTGGVVAAMKHDIKTVTLGDLPGGDYRVVVHRASDNVAVEQQRFTSTMGSVDV